MKFASIDIESTGLNPNHHQILEFGAVLEDTENPLPLQELPSFHAYIVHEITIGDAYALAMNHKILDRIAKRKDYPDFQFLTPDQLGQAFGSFLQVHLETTQITVAGKNFGNFDNQFLLNLPKFFNFVQFNHRFIDPGSIWFDPKIDTEKPPNLDDCLERASIDKSVEHTAIADALDVIAVIRKKFQYA